MKSWAKLLSITAHSLRNGAFPSASSSSAHAVANRTVSSAKSRSKRNMAYICHSAVNCVFAANRTDLICPLYYSKKKKKTWLFSGHPFALHREFNTLQCSLKLSEHLWYYYNLILPLAGAKCLRCVCVCVCTNQVKSIKWWCHPYCFFLGEGLSVSVCFLITGCTDTFLWHPAVSG